MDLPCYGAKLKGDYHPPFTCGSDTRRSIIKYFVRDEINKDSAGNSLTESLVRKRIQLLKGVWNNTKNFPCKCSTAGEKRTHGAYSLACCKVFDEGYSSSEPCTCLDGFSTSFACCTNGNNFMPDTIGGVLFDEVPPDDVVAAIIEKIEPYIAGIMTDKDKHRAFKEYNNKGKVARWDWSATGMGESATKASGLYSTQEPIMFYNASEAGYPFKRDSTVWEMCAGLVGQVRPLPRLFITPPEVVTTLLSNIAKLACTVLAKPIHVGSSTCNKCTPFLRHFLSHRVMTHACFWKMLHVNQLLRFVFLGCMVPLAATNFPPSTSPPLH